MGPTHFKIMFCNSMHYFEVVLCTLLVPSEIFLGVFIEISWKSIGSNPSGSLARTFGKQANLTKKYVVFCEIDYKL